MLFYPLTERREFPGVQERARPSSYDDEVVVLSSNSSCRVPVGIDSGVSNRPERLDVAFRAHRCVGKWEVARLNPGSW